MFSTVVCIIYLHDVVYLTQCTVISKLMIPSVIPSMHSPLWIHNHWMETNRQNGNTKGRPVKLSMDLSSANFIDLMSPLTIKSNQREACYVFNKVLVSDYPPIPWFLKNFQKIRWLYRQWKYTAVQMHSLLTPEMDRTYGPQHTGISEVVWLDRRHRRRRPTSDSHF